MGDEEVGTSKNAKDSVVGRVGSRRLKVEWSPTTCLHNQDCELLERCRKRDDLPWMHHVK